jgi:hypothetical protein
MYSAVRCRPGTGQEYGAIGYTHAGGVDRPLAAYKLGVNAAVIAPHTNLRGVQRGACMAVQSLALLAACAMIIRGDSVKTMHRMAFAAVVRVMVVAAPGVWLQASGTRQGVDHPLGLRRQCANHRLVHGRRTR